MLRGQNKIVGTKSSSFDTLYVATFTFLVSAAETK